MKTPCGFALNAIAVAMTAVFMLGLMTAAMAQEANESITVGGVKITGLPDDWSYHHVVFSDPGTAEQAIQKGAYERWFGVVNNPRYVIQQLERRAPARGPASADVDRIEEEARLAASLQKAKDPYLLASQKGGAQRKDASERDWSQGLEAGQPMQAAYPAVWSASFTQANCLTDNVVYVTGKAGSSSAASVVAYYNLYSGCPTGGGNPPSVPSIYWAYNTGAAAYTSPVISPDGTQIAFVQYSSVYISSVVLIKWAQSTSTQNESITHPLTLTSQSSGSAYRNCIPSAAVPCMYTMTLNHMDSYSNAYYDISTDKLYVGDNSAYLHSFTGVFNGIPSATEASGFPVRLRHGSSGFYDLTSPVVDDNTGLVMVGNLAGSAFWVTTSGTVSASTSTSSKCAGTSGMNDSPLIDSTAQREYVFFDDVAISGSYFDQIDEYNFAATPPNTLVSRVNVGNSEASAGKCDHAYFFSGNFDNVYYQSMDPPSGNLWVVGNSIGPSTLYQVPITSNVMSTSATSIATLSNSSSLGYASPVTEFCNNNVSNCTSNGTQTTSGTDYLFFSVYEGTLSGCTSTGANGCVVAYNITVPASPSLVATLNKSTPTLYPSLEATGGIVVDNSLSSPAGTSNVYFNTRNNVANSCGSGQPEGICAVQASQAGLD